MVATNITNSSTSPLSFIETGNKDLRRPLTEKAKEVFMYFDQNAEKIRSPKQNPRALKFAYRLHWKFEINNKILSNPQLSFQSLVFDMTRDMRPEWTPKEVAELLTWAVKIYCNAKEQYGIVVV
jgi:hypothetical protein